MRDSYTLSNITKFEWDAGDGEWRDPGWKVTADYTATSGGAGSSGRSTPLKFNDKHWKLVSAVFEQVLAVEVGQKYSDGGATATVIGVFEKAEENYNKGVAIQWGDGSVGLRSKAEIQQWERVDE